MNEKKLVKFGYQEPGYFYALEVHAFNKKDALKRLRERYKRKRMWKGICVWKW